MLFNKKNAKNKKIIGFVMSGSGHIANRDMKIEDWEPLWRAFPDYDFIALHYDLDDKVKIALEAYPNIYHYVGKIDDFMDTACLIDACDYVLCIDSAVAHLAGMQGEGKDGKKIFVHLLLPHYPSFRWGLKNTTTPWYSNMMIWRQTKNGDWHSVMGRLINHFKQNNHD